jgi:hypothetical protein
MMVVALGIHLGALALFQIVYPSASAEEPREASLILMDRADPRNEAFYAWLDAADPALFSRFHTDKREELPFPSVVHRPGFVGGRPDLAIPPTGIQTILPPVQIEGMAADYLGGIDRIPAGPVIRTPSRSSRIVATAELAGLEWIAPDVSALRRVPSELPQPTVMRVTVSKDGWIRNAFLQQSSGSEVLDQLAWRTLFEQNEKTAGGRELRGEVWFLWGSDVFPERTPVPRS